MAYPLRLPDALDAAARARADSLGISLNALLCVALDAYLRGPVGPAPTGQPSPAIERPSKTSYSTAGLGEPVKLTRAEKQAIYERDKASRKALVGR